MTEFEQMGLADSILRGLAEEGYNHPFPIQENTIPSLLEGKEVIGQAKTGSGKTAAFALPILHMIDERNKEVQALILAPTRELALQIADEITRLGKYRKVRVVTIYGGQSINNQLNALRKGTQIVVGTPGRVIDMLKRGWLDLSFARYAVLDEADRMLDMGFIEDVEYILRKLPASRQLSLFSATMPKQIVELSRKYMKQPVRVMMDSEEPSVDELDQYYTFAERRDKLQRLVEIMKAENPSSALVFCRTKAGARKVAWELERRYFKALPMHGDLSQAQREASLAAFRNGRAEILVATDVASRGIDVKGIELVINFDFPEEPVAYFHRVGRTARAGNSGKSISILTDENLSDFHRVLRMTKSRIKPYRKEDESRISSNVGYSYGAPFARAYRYRGMRPYRRYGE
ncbi:MAG: DEAD/DEAH box helicase [Conexivisphaerales archaeon]